MISFAPSAGQETRADELAFSRHFIETILSDVPHFLLSEAHSVASKLGVMQFALTLRAVDGGYAYDVSYVPSVDRAKVRHCLLQFVEEMFPESEPD